MNENYKADAEEQFLRALQESLTRYRVEGTPEAATELRAAAEIVAYIYQEPLFG